jgi:mRNA interferase MazF
LINQSNINTALVCALTTNLSRENAPGNVRLYKDEANLPKPSVIVVSQMLTIDKLELRDKIGTLSKKRVDEILEGIKLLTEPREVEETE